MTTLFGSPHLIDVILVFTAVEAVALIYLRRRRPRSVPRQLGVNGLNGDIAAVGMLLLPGVFLMLAIREALAGVVWPWVPAALVGALVTHLLDLRSRWRA